MDVDLILLSRDLSPLREDVRYGIESQVGVRLQLQRITGEPCADDGNRWETICRARNKGKLLGLAPWVMCLDDDVILSPYCAATLLEALWRRPEFAALAADSAGEMNPGWENWDYPTHVSMAAVLFRREALAELTFRWEPDKCECRCCCEDLRRAGFAIGYLPGAVARHQPSPRAGSERTPSASAPKQKCTGVLPRRPGQILTAFDRRDLRRFSRIFLPSLRSKGNHERVTAVVYALYPSEQATLRAKPGVDVVAIADNGVCPALRRLRDFQDVIARWPDDTPIAYWDAGDILFQSNLEPLWDLVGGSPDVLLVGREPLSYPENPVIQRWTNCIRDPEARRRAFELTSTHTFLNSGFAAGTARALMRYLREADRLLHSPALEGVGDWGDQLALNLFCYSYAGACRELAAAWNFALAGRDPLEFFVDANGRFQSRLGMPIHVVHGNSGILRSWELPHLA
jgi:hypothetical protein